MGIKSQLAAVRNVDEYKCEPGEQSEIVNRVSQLQPEPFPVEALPDRFKQLAESISAATGVDISFPVLPMFSAVSTAIGNSRVVSTKDGNQQPLMLWTATIGASGTQKSEPYFHAEEPLREMDAEIFQEYQAAVAQHELAKQVHKAELSDWKKNREGSPPREPSKPPKGRLLLSDFSYEAMVESHAGSPRGLLISCEELSSWFGSFERYSGKGPVSGEQSRFLQAYDGRSITSERVSSSRYVPRPFINVSGTIQPGILAKCLTSESRENGLAARLWMSYPEPVAIRWSDRTVSQLAKREYQVMIRELWALRTQNDEGWPEPTVLPFHHEAQRLFANFMNATGADASGMTDDCRAAAVKFIGRCARIAGVLHCCEQVNGDAIDAWSIQPETVEKAIKISQWSLNEMHRIYQLLQEPEEIRHLRQIASWIDLKGGVITARDLCRGRRDMPNTEHAETILMNLVKLGFGAWRPIHKSREFWHHSKVPSTIPASPKVANQHSSTMWAE